MVGDMLWDDGCYCLMIIAMRIVAIDSDCKLWKC